MAGVHADQGVDLARVHQVAQHGLEHGRVVVGIDGDQPAGAAADARGPVEFGCGELG